MKGEKKRFIKQGFLFFLFFILIFSLINIAYMSYEKENLNYYKVDESLDLYLKNNSIIGHLFIGDSHVARSIVDTRLNHSFNFAIGGEGNLETYLRLKDLIGKNITIQNLVIEVDSHKFFKDNKLYFRETVYFEKFISLNEMSMLSNHSLLSLYKHKFFPIIGVGKEGVKKILSIISDSNNRIIDDVNSDLIAKNKVNQHFGSKKINLHEVLFLKKMINIAVDKKINLIFIQYPVSIYYDQALKKEGVNYKIGNDYLLFKLVNLTNDTLMFFDYYDLFFYDDFYFLDSDHLNQFGADLFTEIIATDLNISLID